MGHCFVKYNKNEFLEKWNEEDINTGPNFLLLYSIYVYIFYLVKLL